MVAVRLLRGLPAWCDCAMSAAPTGPELVNVAADANPIGGAVPLLCSTAEISAVGDLSKRAEIPHATPLYVRCRDYRQCARANARARRAGVPGVLCWHRW